MGFRKVKEIVDIFVLNYVVNRELGKKGTLVVMFVDLKAVFDSVSRETVIGAMRGKRVRTGLVKRGKTAKGNKV